MRVFIVQSHLGGGGAERVGCLLAKGFAQQGHQTFMVTNLYDEVKYSVDKGVVILNLMSPYKGKVGKWGSALRNLRGYVKGYRPDVVIGIMQTCSLISRLACMGTKTRVIMTEHDSFERPASAPMPKVERFCKFWLNRIYECVTVITQADKDFVGNRLKHVVVMPNPLLLGPVKEIPQKENIVLAAGRLDDWHCKGFDVLLRAWSIVVKSERRIVNGEGWKLQIAGAGSEGNLNYLKRLCKENDVENCVVFLGHVKDMETLYRQSSIFVLSSRYEGFGLVLIEAMSQGCACVACDYKGRQREIVCPEGQGSRYNVQSSNGKFEACKNGILCEPDDVESLADGIQKMIEEKEYRDGVRKNVVERSKYYSLDNTMDRWEVLLASLKHRS